MSAMIVKVVTTRFFVVASEGREQPSMLKQANVTTRNLVIPNFVTAGFKGVNAQTFLLLTKCQTGTYHSQMPKAPTRHASSAVEDYLERILDLINTKGYARVVDIAQGLKISQASVTNMVQRLDAEGLLKYEKYRGLVLTASGEALAKNITRRHRLLSDFFRLFGLEEDVIYHDVEGMEHHISPPTLRAIEALTAQLERQPALIARVRHQIEGGK